MSPRILVVDNDREMVELIERHLVGEGWAVTGLTDGAAALAAVDTSEFDVILTDLVMGQVNGMTLLRAARERWPRAHVILMTAFGSLETAIEAMRHGAYDYLTKPFRLGEVSLTVNRALEDRRLREENQHLRAQVEERFSFDRMLGRSRAMRDVLERIRAVAGTDATVLIAGESGTGKELAARAIHQHSARQAGPFVAVNCAAIPEGLLESELFGHERGAFTGADRKRRGLFPEADGGTLFLDEVGDLPAPFQAKLLRVLQDRTVRPVGSNREVPFDVRLVAATNRDLSGLVRDGKFREDLYYRLAVVPVRLPSLRERGEDVMLLAGHFLDRAATSAGKRLEGFDEGAAAWLLRHRWPGNVREVQNVVERAAILARGSRVTLADLETEFAAVTSVGTSMRPTLAELEDQYVRRVLEETGGDKAAAAKVLGISVRTLQRRFK